VTTSIIYGPRPVTICKITVFERNTTNSGEEKTMMRSNTSKKIQNNTQKLLLAKNYLEQELESQGYRGHVKYDRTNKSLIQFRVKEGTIAVLKEGKISIFEIPVKKFRSSAMPLEFQTIDMDSIQIQKATCCKKCHSWKQQADITKCSCGGYLVSRKRFCTSTIESWDAEYLEIEFARKDIREASKIERTKPKKARYIPTGMTHRLAGVSSVSENAKPQMIRRVSETGAEWLEEFGTSPLVQNVIIRKINGFSIPPNDENIQASLRTSLSDSFSSEVNN
jgi:hypothetical protein